MFLLVYLISRFLASAVGGQQQIQRSAYSLLHKAREVTHKWMREIIYKLHNAVDDDEFKELQRRACEMAATCRATFDVDPGIHLDTLLRSSSDVAILVECTIRIHDNTPPNIKNTSLDFQKLLHRDRRLSHFLESPVSKLILAEQRGLDIAIKSVWSEYRHGYGWRQLSEPNSRWLTTTTNPFSGQRAQQVHYNILNGKLLVDGYPLGCLPPEIVGHSTYRGIFGQVLIFFLTCNSG